MAAAQTGSQLVEMCRSAAPDLVIADVKMHDLDGIGAEGVPVILLSSEYDDDALSRLGGTHRANAESCK